MKKSIESQIKSIRFDAMRLEEVIKENLTTEAVRQSAIEIVNRLAYELVTLGADNEQS